LQVVFVPSFEPGYAWDVRELTPAWRLFRSSVVTGQSPIRLIGYEELNAPSELLHSYFERLRAITMPIGPSRLDIGGGDGTTYQLALFGGAFSQLRLQWWSEYPAEWSEVVGVANDMIEKFLSYDAKDI
jgi:hypothetical protein